jgi:hypothetical protein
MQSWGYETKYRITKAAYARPIRCLAENGLVNYTCWKGQHYTVGHRSVLLGLLGITHHKFRKLYEVDNLLKTLKEIMPREMTRNTMKTRQYYQMKMREEYEANKTV